MTLRRIERPSHDPLDALREAWEYRELGVLLARRDLTVRYRQALLGIGWAVLQPLAQMLLFTAVFGGMARLPSGGRPYALVCLTGLVAWTFVANSVNAATASLVSNVSLLTRVWFPRLLLPLSAVGACAVDLLVGLLLFPLALAAAGQPLSWGILWLPAYLALATCLAAGAGIWLGALCVRYRDVRHGLGLLLQVWLFLSPIAYSSDAVPARWRGLFSLNPMAVVAEGVRACVLGGPRPDASSTLLATLVALAVLYGGIVQFRKREVEFADVV